MDQVTFRHPSGATTNTTERGAVEFARLNPEWKRLTPADLMVQARPGIELLTSILVEVEKEGISNRDIEKDWDMLAMAMRRPRA